MNPNLIQLRERPKLWRSLEELADTDEFRAYLNDEFAHRSTEWLDPANRRGFLKVMGASLALAGMTACTKQPKELIVPYVRQPPEFIPGKPLFYATAMAMSGVATGLLVESHLGRPTKIEGNPDHPGSLGASDYFHQASILTLYDPDRTQVVTNKGNISSWVAFQAAMASAREGASVKRGAGLRILSEPVISPTLGAQINAFLKDLPEARWHQFDPLTRAGVYGGATAAFGRSVNTIYRFDQADVVVSLDADFLSCGRGSLRYAHDFIAKRRVLNNVERAEQPKENLQEGYQPGPDAPYRNQGATHTEEDKSPRQSAEPVRAQGTPVEQTTMSRLYVAEPHPTPTGGMADHRYRVRAGEIEDIAWALAAALGVAGAGQSGSAFQDVAAIAKDLQAHRGASIVIAGEYQPAAVHALAHAMNQALGNVGKTVIYTEPLETSPVDQIASLRQLVSDMNAGQVETLLILGGNPVYAAPADLDFASAMNKVKLRAHLSLYDNETSSLCHWVIPEAHYLESWSDARGYDGTVTFIQPLIAPLYDGKSAHELVAVLAGESARSPRDIVREYWGAQVKTNDFETFWETALHDGVVPNTALPVINVTAKAPGAPTPKQPQGIEIVFRPDPGVWDGSFSNNSWMQELPKPQNKMTWDNAVWISPKTADRLGIHNEDIVEVKYRDRKVEGGAWVMPGHADDSITVHFGYGRTRGGKVAEDIGFNAYALRTADAPVNGWGAELRRTGGKHNFATTQHTQVMEGRDPVRIAPLEEYKKNPGFPMQGEDAAIPKYLTLYPDYKYEGYKWGMAIDLNSCVGCSACVIACQAENNIPVVGKAEVGKGRHMHWLRVDRYFRGQYENPELYFQPVPCMHCENAPCELVCPVAATVHSGDGLNQMVYNRCVGTRYCSNNCPYKVRRFNFFLYSDWYTQSLYGMRNPDVTVRSRGVMEKCTYCVQRINAAKIQSEKEGRRVVDGEIVPACEQACPTRAIVFGDINDPRSRVARIKAQARDYSLLEDLNTRPRTTYQARLRNPNPEIEHA
jgi:MoCo/4Fe-4S cofactor protein with predicted Tat translocation signal